MDTAGRGTPSLREQAPYVSPLRRESGSYCLPPCRPAILSPFFSIFLFLRPTSHTYASWHVTARAPASRGHSRGMGSVERQEMVLHARRARAPKSHDQADASITVAKSCTACKTARKSFSLARNLKACLGVVLRLWQVADHSSQ